MVPHLITALNGPINELEARILESMPATERWFRLEWMEHTPTFYASVDLRNAGFKLAPVDTNLFPGGFNHLTPQMLPQAVQAAMAAIEKICPEARNLLLIPEPGVRCSFYLDHLATLVRIFTQAGLNVRLGALDPAQTEPEELRLANGSSLLIEPLVRKRGRLTLIRDLLDRLPDTRCPEDKVDWPELGHEPLEEKFGVVKPIKDFPIAKPKKKGPAVKPAPSSESRKA